MPAKSKRQARQSQPEARLRVPLDRILIYALAITLFVVPLFICPAIKANFLGKTAILLVLISILSLLWGLAALSRRSWTIRLPWIVFPFVLFALAALLSLLHATNARVAIQSLLIGLFYLQLLLIIASEVRRKQDVDLLLFSLLLAGVLAGVVALLELAGAIRTAGGQEMISTFGNRNFLGGYLAYLIFPSLALVLGKRRPAARLLLGFFILFVITILILVNQMGSLLGLIAGGGASLFLALLIRRGERRIPWRLLGVFVVITMLAISVIVVRIWPALRVDEHVESAAVAHADETLPSTVYVAPSTVASVLEANSMRERLLFWIVGLRMFADHPITGIGLGNYGIVYTRYEADVRSSQVGDRFQSVQRPTEFAHNDYVQIVAELGVGGILAIVAFLAVLSWSIWIRLRAVPVGRPQSALEILLLLAGLVAFLTHALVSFPLHIPVSSLVAITLLGLLYCPVYGEPCTARVVLKKRFSRVLVILITLIGSAGVVFAGREVAGHLLLNQGFRQLHAGDSGAAAETLSRSVDLTFSPRDALYYLAIAQARSGEYTVALANLERCLKRISHGLVYLVYADLASQLGEIEPARRAILTLLGSNPERYIEPQARYVQAQIERLDGDNQLAILLLRELLESDPSQERAHITLAEISLEDGNSLDARAHYESALEVIDGKTLEIRRLLASVSALPVSKYEDATSELAFLQSERDRVLDGLQGLPSAP